MKKFFLLIVIGSIYAYALPTIFVHDMVYTNIDPLQNNTQNNIATNSLLGNNLSIFNTAVKSAIIASQKFKLISLSNQNKPDTLTDNTLYDKSVASAPNALILNNMKIANSMINKQYASEAVLGKRITPDYILLSKVAAFTDGTDINPINDTNKSTIQYSISIAVDYQLLKNNLIVASFTAYGHANEVKIIDNNSLKAKQNYNIPLLLTNAAKDLSYDIITYLNKLSVTSVNNFNDTRVITDLKIYN